MQFNKAERKACRRLLRLGLAEDLGRRGDLTTQALVPEDLVGSAIFTARTGGIVAGLPTVELLLATMDFRFMFQYRRRMARAWDLAPMFAAMDIQWAFQPLVEDGTRVEPGDKIAKISGLIWSILAAERLSLNFLQHLSGIATTTRQYVDAVAGLSCQILDTRKTTPGWRLLEKYAVRCGGGHNHRLGLHDGILIKDNHLAAVGGVSAMEKAVRAARARVGHSIPVELEVDNLEQLEVALFCQLDIVLLDNMSTDQLREAVHRRNEKAPKILLEASGGVTLANVRAIAETGVDRISVGALTHSAPALDIALDFEN
jgi:nicotinate-nucleotide pyrophosphorylase (carboxylating)